MSIERRPDEVVHEMSRPTMRPASAADHDTVTSIVTLAFTDDPRWGWVLARPDGGTDHQKTFWRHIDHYYLSLLGTHPDHRGQGIGMALLAQNLAVIDAEHAAAYLESSNPVNNERYASVGFEPIGQFAHPGDGPAVTTMWRPARRLPGPIAGPPKPSFLHPRDPPGPLSGPPSP